MSSTCSGLLHCASTLAITGAERDVLNLALAASQPRSSSFLQRAGRGYCRYCFFHDCFHYCLSKNKPLRLGFMRRAAGPVALAATLAAIHTRTKHNSLLRQPSNARPNKVQTSGNRYMPVQPKGCTAMPPSQEPSAAPRKNAVMNRLLRREAAKGSRLNTRPCVITCIERTLTSDIIRKAMIIGNLLPNQQPASDTATTPVPSNTMTPLQ